MDNYIDKTRPNKESKRRIKAFDFLKFAAIFLVLWGHSIQYLLSSNYYDEPVYRIIYSFHMPLFMMISGYFSHSSMLLSPITFIKKKFVQLLLPTFSWVIVLAFITFLSQVHYLNQGLEQWIIHIKDLIAYILSGFLGPHPFWFLKTCFFCYCLAYCGSHLRLNKFVWIILTIIISQCIKYYVAFGIMYPCFIVGMELKENQKFYSQVCRHYLWLLGLFLLMLCFWDQFFWGYDGIIKVMMCSIITTNNHFLLIIVSELYRLTIGIVGSLSFIGLICALVNQDITNKFISLCCNWGQYTLGIYILQVLLLETYLATILILDDFNFFVFNFIVAPVLSFLIMALCVYIIRLMSKSPILAFFFWGKS